MARNTGSKPDLVCSFDVKGVSVLYTLWLTGGLTKVNRLTDFSRMTRVTIGIFHGSLVGMGYPIGVCL